MKQFLIFLGGFVVGVIITYSVMFTIRIRSDYSERVKLAEMLMSKYVKENSLDKEPQVQYIEVKGKKGTVTLHTGMPKDSVQILIGKPDEVDLHTTGSTTYEKWGYKINNKYGMPKGYQISDLTIDFEDGKLKGASQE